MRTTETLLVGFTKDPAKGTAVLTVGRHRFGGVPEIINAFAGEDAEALYEKLIGKGLQKNGDKAK